MAEPPYKCCECFRVPELTTSQSWDCHLELRALGWKQSRERLEEWTCPECKETHEQIEPEELDYACKICGNTPDEYSIIRHGRGCYTQSENGGGESFCEAHYLAKGKPDDPRTD